MRQVEYVVDQLHQRGRSLLGHLPQLALGLVKRALAQPRQRQRDGLQRRPQLMAGAGDEQVLGLHCIHQLGLQRPLAGDVDHIAGPGDAAAVQRAGHGLAVQPARAMHRVVVVRRLLERLPRGQAFGPGGAQAGGLRCRRTQGHRLEQAGHLAQPGAQEVVDRIAHIALQQPPVGAGDVLEHHARQAVGHRQQPLLGLGAPGHFQRQAAHPPDRAGGQQQQRGAGGHHQRQPAPPGEAGHHVHCHPAAHQPVALGGRDVGQRAVDQRHQRRRGRRRGEVELRRQVVDPRHLPQHAVVVAVDAQVGVQLGLDGGIGIAAGHHVHRGLARRRVDDADVGIALGQQFTQRVLGRQRQALAAQAVQIPVQRRVTARHDLVGHLQVGVGEAELPGPRRRAGEEGHQVDAAGAQRIEHVGHAVERHHVDRGAQAGGHFGGVVGADAGVAAVGGGLVEQGEAAHCAHPQHAAAGQLGALVGLQRQRARHGAAVAAQGAERRLQRRHR